MKRQFVAAGSAGILLAAVGAVGWVATASDNGPGASDLPAEKASMMASEQALNDLLAQQAKDPSVSASIVAAKKRAIDEYEATKAPPAEAAPPESGVFESREAPFSTEDFLATSHWGGQISGKPYLVYAGSAGLESNTGEVIVDSSTGAEADPEHMKFGKLADVGPLTLVSQDGRLLTLLDARGSTHQFDVTTASFVD
ncbi:MAG: hypothetical protein QM655_16250 [Nocardioidaceae bacterium]